METTNQTFIEMTNFVSWGAAVLGVLVIIGTLLWWFNWVDGGMGRTDGEGNAVGPDVARSNNIRGNVTCLGLLILGAAVVFVPYWF